MTSESAAGNLQSLPADLPVPQDDGACDHLTGLAVPSVMLQSTSGRMVDMSCSQDMNVVFIYPMTGKPGMDLPDGWNAIPGARGCTPEACAFRDRSDLIKNLGAAIFGASSQTTSEQLEASNRLQLPFELLSDHAFNFADALSLPTFIAGGRKLIRRLTLIILNGKIVKVFYPIFPPDQHANEVIDWLATQKKNRV